MTSAAAGGRHGGHLVDAFDAPALREDLWVPHYLPQWTTADRSIARYRLVPEGLQLLIEEDQLDWRDEDGPLRVSNLQTGAFSGPVGSARGTHRHRADGLVVRTDVGTRVSWAPSAGAVSVTVTATKDADCMLAAWLVGTEHRDEGESGEICIFEIDAAAIGEDSTTARCGIKTHHDPGLHDDMSEVALPFPADRRHTWSVTWGGGRTAISCEGRVLRQLDQAPDYPLFLMIDLFEIGARTGRYPKTALVHRVAGRDDRETSDPLGGVCAASRSGLQPRIPASCSGVPERPNVPGMTGFAGPSPLAD